MGKKMVNQVVLNYLKTYKDKYNLDDLKKEIIKKGYSEGDVNEALKVLVGDVSFVPKKVNPLPTLNFVGEGKKRGFGWGKFILVLFLILLLGAGLIVLLNYLGFDFFNWNFFTDVLGN